MFILTYWYEDEIKEIAKRCGMSENNVSVTLSRTRKKLKDYLTERGYSI
jgi:RNA polymerase sigma-70 factor (ECF subfamily)